MATYNDGPGIPVRSEVRLHGPETQGEIGVITFIDNSIPPYRKYYVQYTPIGRDHAVTRTFYRVEFTWIGHDEEPLRLGSVVKAVTTGAEWVIQDYEQRYLAVSGSRYYVYKTEYAKKEGIWRSFLRGDIVPLSGEHDGVIMRVEGMDFLKK